MSAHTAHHGEAVEKEIDERFSFGFWLYLLTDVLLFGTLFATYAALRPATYGGPGPKELFSLPFVMVETLILLTSSFTFGLAMLGKQSGKIQQVKIWLGVTMLLGASFIAMEIYEFQHLIHGGHGPQANAFLSAFFGLVGTHGLHVFFGLIWAGLMFYQLSTKGLTPMVSRKLNNLSLFWHFLDIVWIFVFTYVYLMGAV